MSSLSLTPHASGPQASSLMRVLCESRTLKADPAHGLRPCAVCPARPLSKRLPSRAPIGMDAGLVGLALPFIKLRRQESNLRQSG